MHPLADALDAPVTGRENLIPQGTAEERAWWYRWLEFLAGREGATRVCRLALLGTLLGAYLFPSDGLRVFWLVSAACVACLFVDWRKTWASARGDGLRVAGLHFLAWMTTRSLAGYGMVDGDSGMLAAGWLLGTGLLVVFVVLVWISAQNEEALASLGRWVGLAASLAMLLSLTLFYCILPGHVFGERLMNRLVYGGWNPVCTGLTSGFSAIWLVGLLARERSLLWRGLMHLSVVLLLVAVCFTRSRGALLALLTAYAVLTCTRGLRRMVIPWCTFLLVIAGFAFSGPWVERIAEAQVRSRTELSASLIALQPVAEMVQRGDAGRLDLYQRAFQSFNEPDRWILGIGQWGPEEACCRSLTRLQYHLHSAYFATFIHGGLIGLALLLVVLAIGSRRAYSLARQGNDIWLALLAYGSAGLLFDGQTFTSFTSIPQMEVLIFAFPLAAASSIWWHQRGGRSLKLA